MKFFLNWRLKKHEALHTSQITRNCHYFNNNKRCPFDDLGCMFAHRESDICKFDQVCSKSLCSYKHSNKNPTPLESSENDTCQNKQVDSENSADNVKDYQFECEYCDFKSETYTPFLDHINTYHLESDEDKDDDQN